MNEWPRALTIIIVRSEMVIKSFGQQRDSIAADEIKNATLSLCFFLFVVHRTKTDRDWNL